MSFPLKCHWPLAGRRQDMIHSIQISHLIHLTSIPTDADNHFDRKTQTVVFFQALIWMTNALIFYETKREHVALCWYAIHIDAYAGKTTFNSHIANSACCLFWTLDMLSFSPWLQHLFTCYWLASKAAASFVYRHLIWHKSTDLCMHNWCGDYLQNCV